jgi:hypothetical protein
LDELVTSGSHHLNTQEVLKQIKNQGIYNVEKLLKRYEEFTDKAEEIWDDMSALFVAEKGQKRFISLPGKFLKHKEALAEAMELIESIDKVIRLK